MKFKYKNPFIPKYQDYERHIKQSPFKQMVQQIRRVPIRRVRGMIDFGLRSAGKDKQYHRAVKHSIKNYLKQDLTRLIWEYEDDNIFVEADEYVYIDGIPHVIR